MEESLLALLKEGGGTVAVIIVVILFIRYISQRDGAIEEHMKNEIETFTQMSETFRQHTETNKEMYDYFRKLNGKLKKED